LWQLELRQFSSTLILLSIRCIHSMFFLRNLFEWVFFSWRFYSYSIFLLSYSSSFDPTTIYRLEIEINQLFQTFLLFYLCSSWVQHLSLALVSWSELCFYAFVSLFHSRLIIRLFHRIGLSLLMISYPWNRDGRSPRSLLPSPSSEDDRSHKSLSSLMLGVGWIDLCWVGWGIVTSIALHFSPGKTDECC